MSIGSKVNYLITSLEFILNANILTKINEKYNVFTEIKFYKNTYVIIWLTEKIDSSWSIILKSNFIKVFKISLTKNSTYLFNFVYMIYNKSINKNRVLRR